MSLFDTGIRPAIDAYLQTKRDEERDYQGYWSASSAGYCMRKLIFERLKVPHTKEDDARLQRVFEAGHIFHEWAQRITREAGLSLAQELEVQDEELMVRGHFDDLVLWDGHLILYDYKTAHSKSFHYSKGRPMSYYHRLQLGTYMYILRKHNPDVQYWPTNNGQPELLEGRILRISKDDLVMEEKQLIWGEDIEKDVLDYWQALNEFWEAKKLPPCTCADQEGGFMAKEAYNPYYYNGEPCSLEHYELCKLEGRIQ